MVNSRRILVLDYSSSFSFCTAVVGDSPSSSIESAIFLKKIFFLTLVSPTHSSSFSPADGFPPGCNFLGSFPVCGKFADFFLKKIEEVK